MFKIDYISSACNKMPHVVDWGRNNLICYAANNAIAIYDPLSGNIGAVLSTLHAHSGRVNAVQWIRFSSSSKPEVELISCSSDGSAIIWTMVDPKSVSFQPRYTLMHNKPIKICDAVYHPKSEMELVICTCTINGCAQIWSRNDHGSISRIQSLDYEAKLIVMARLSILPGSSQGNPNMLLVLAFEDSSLHLMSSECCQNSSSEP
ncbi:hypothetical protein QAD02_002118 [Eretmocerus hayati]|uniref:Uncharacterized protein n=1 Tax=Eretmocerus hayati TaxID=131215 RepID=A0ACC2NIA4_9HYME|nr:hypothetical protein QAD02_002118 [Eretmocerus hayati]